MALANPVVELLPSDEFFYEEGCLSFRKSEESSLAPNGPRLPRFGRSEA